MLFFNGVDEHRVEAKVWRFDSADHELLQVHTVFIKVVAFHRQLWILDFADWQLCERVLDHNNCFGLALELSGRPFDGFVSEVSLLTEPNLVN